MLSDRIMANLKIARDALVEHREKGNLPLQVNMSQWLSAPDDFYTDDEEVFELFEVDYFKEEKLECGSCGCALGHISLLLGDSEHEQFHPQRLDAEYTIEREHFSEYATRLFTDLDPKTFDTFDVLNRDIVCDWLFHYNWADSDNTLDGIIARFNYVIESGNVPEWFVHAYSEDREEFDAFVDRYKKEFGVNETN